MFSLKSNLKKNYPTFEPPRPELCYLLEVKSCLLNPTPTGRTTVCTPSKKKTPKTLKRTRICRECNFLSILRSSCFFHDTNRFHRRQSLTSPHTFVLPRKWPSLCQSLRSTVDEWHGDREVYKVEFCRELKAFFFALRSPLLYLSLPELVRFSCLNNYGN